jgi:uncharacterized repeat protein (TIGR03806 family)
MLAVIVVVLVYATTGFTQPYGLKNRVPNTSFLLSTGGDTLAEMDLKPVFENLSFQEPVFLTSARDESNRVFVIEKRGVIKVFPNQEDVQEMHTFLDIRTRVNDSPSEAGLLSMAFHPQYPDSNKFYVYYTYGNLFSRISEFRVTANPDSADLNTERILLTLEQPYSNHNGGQIAFGPDQYLYIGFGDGGSGGDPLGNGQNRQTLLGAILRIDVDRSTASLSYAIPVDNPLVGNVNGWREEIWAWGLRNPWRFSFDRLSGLLWAADVGQNQWEEVDIISGGKNYGWNLMEGFHCYPSGANCDTSGLVMPIIEYDHSKGKSVTGGYVYRGLQLSRLYGVYLYGDYITRNIWGLRYDQGEVMENKIIALSPSEITSFGEDDDGEVYVVGHDGSIYRFAEKSGVPTPDNIPRTIAASGLFTDIYNWVPAPGLIPYTINAPFWSDNALKTRLIALPDTSKIIFSRDSSWQFPPNAVIVKNFFLETERDNPQSRKIIETRFLVRQPDKELWEGFSYLWNDQETDATLLESSYTRAFQIIDGDSSYTQNYYYPGRDECKVCHTPAAGFVLGVRTAQINKEHLYFSDEDSVWDNQLRSYNHIRLFSTEIGDDYSGFPQLPDPFNEDQEIGQRARAYLDVNCAGCHRPGSSGRTNMDLRYSIPLEVAHIVDVPPALGDMDISGAMRVKPGAADSSLLYLRMLNLDEFRMPPLASSIVDQQGAELIRTWIESLGEALGLSPDSKDTVPGSFKLFKAYPNPFNAVTTIGYQLPETTLVQIDVYDISGQKITTLVNAKQPPGRYNVKWNADNLASGLYFYTMNTKEFVDVKKIILLK